MHHQSLVWMSFNRKQQVGLLNHQMWLLCCYMLRTAWPDAEALSATASKEVATSREHRWRWLESASHLDVIRWYAFVVLEPQNRLFPVKSRLCVLTGISGSADKPTPSLQVTFEILCQSKLVWSTERSSLQELLLHRFNHIYKTLFDCVSSFCVSEVQVITWPLWEHLNGVTKRAMLATNTGRIMMRVICYIDVWWMGHESQLQLYKLSPDEDTRDLPLCI